MGKGREPFDIRLHVTKDSARAHYVALSHCWGDVIPPRTLKANLRRHLRLIRYSTLPLTFQDAILYAYWTRCRYVWIDSLCILQDDPDDWAAEAANMSSIYSNALFTVAATAAEDCSVGTQFSYNSAFVVPLGREKALIRLADHFNLDPQDAPLNVRGWTFQEAALSKRMICFSKSQMLWKCCTKQESEDGLFNTSDYSPHRKGDFWNIWASLRINGPGETRYEFWYRMMERYSQRVLKFESDKLAALAGIVEGFKDVIGDSPAMGLWTGDMLNGLMWRVEKYSEGIDGLGAIPSWSWVSIRGPIFWDFTPETISPIGKLEVIDLIINWAGSPMTSPVLQATLRVEGRMKQASLVELGPKDRNSFQLVEIEDDLQKTDKISTTYDTPIHRSSNPEYLGYCYLEKDRKTGTKVWCLEVYNMSKVAGSLLPREHIHKVLVLESLNEDCTQFKRIGIGEVWRISLREHEGSDITVKETFRDLPRQRLDIL